MLLSRLCLILSTPLAISPQKLGHSCSDNNTRSLSSEGHSLDLCAQMSPPAYPVRRRQLRALWGSRLISLLRKPVLQQVGRLRVRDDERGQSGRRPRRPRHCRRGRDAASDPPPRPRSPCRKSSSKWKLIGPFYWNSSTVFLCDELYSFGVWNADGVCCSTWMYRQPQEDWENFLSGVNGFLNQADADMRNRGV
jgi:hypothetical protein